MKTKRRKLTAVQRAAQFCGAAFEMDAFEPQWKRLLDVLGDWCDANKNELTWASLGLYGNGEEVRLTLLVGFTESIQDRDDFTCQLEIDTARDDRLDLVRLDVHAMSGPPGEHIRNHPGELHRFLG